MACIQKRFKLQRCMLGNFMSLLLSAEFFSRSFALKIYPSGVRVECQTVWTQIMPDIFSLIWVQAVAKFSRQIFDVIGSKYGVFLLFRKNSTTFNLRICVFPQFVIFMFNVDHRFALSNRLPQFI